MDVVELRIPIVESDLGTGHDRQNPRNEGVVDLIQKADTWLRLDNTGSIVQPLPGEIDDRVGGLERLVGPKRMIGKPAA